MVPPLSMIEHLLWLEIEKSEDKIYQNIIAQIKDFPRLYSLLDVEVTGTSKYSAQEDELQEIDFLLRSGQNFNYTNELLECIEFNSNTKSEFISYLKEFTNLKYKKKIEVDISIFSNQWQKNIKKIKS